MWRPENWDTQKIIKEEEKRCWEFGYSPGGVDLIEAGANAMLEARKESGIRVKAGDLPESVRLMLGLDSQRYGWINFIPEDEK